MCVGSVGVWVCISLTELHKRAAVGGEDNPHPVEGVGRLGRLHPVDGDLAAHEEDEERDHRPQHLLAERNLFWSRGGKDRGGGEEDTGETAVSDEGWWCLFVCVLCFSLL